MKLKELNVIAAGGISPEAPVFVMFGDNHFAVGKGDMGAGKSSLIKALLIATGTISKDNIDFVNTDSGKLEIGLPFIGNDRKSYEIKVTKSSYKLIYDGESLPEPITQAKRLLGAVGVSPMPIKDEKFDEVVKWLSAYTTKGAEDVQKRRVKLKNDIKDSQNTRAAANRSAKGLTEYLGNEPMFKDWEKSEKKYVKAVDIKDLSEKLNAAGAKSDKYIQNETKVKGQKERKKQIEDQIAALQVELSAVNKNIEVGDKWLTDNKAAKKEYDSIKEQYDNAAQEVANFNKWQDIKRKKTELDEFETVSQRADAKEKELLKDLKELRAEIIPDVKGIDLVLDDEMKDGKLVRKEGLYMNGKNVAQLSESEWWSVVLQIWRKNKVKIIAIDNFQDLGSGAVEILQKLVDDGAYVLAGVMERGTKTLEIEYL